MAAGVADATCRTNADCRVAGNPCMPGFCGGGLCQPTCACIAPDFTAACSPEQAIHCPNPDCHPVVATPPQQPQDAGADGGEQPPDLRVGGRWGRVKPEGAIRRLGEDAVECERGR